MIVWRAVPAGSAGLPGAGNFARPLDPDALTCLAVWSVFLQSIGFLFLVEIGVT